MVSLLIFFFAVTILAAFFFTLLSNSELTRAHSLTSD